MARWSSLLSKVWIHSSLVHLPLEVEGHSERVTQSLLALWSSGHLIPLWMKKRTEKQGSMPIFLKKISGLSYNGDIQLLWKTSSNYFLSSIIMIHLITFKWRVLHAAHTKVSQLLLCLRADLEVPFRLHCRFSVLVHSIIILCATSTSLLH